MSPRLTFWLVVVLGLLLAAPNSAQVVRETDVSSIGALLTGSYDDYTFKSSGGEILFADIDRAIYQIQGRGAHDHEEEAEPHEPGGEEGGCSDGGPSLLCLQVLNEFDELLCWADRPRNPGWQTDPRLACPIEAMGRSEKTYTLRVSMRSEGENTCGDKVYPAPPAQGSIAYLLNVSLRRAAQDGSLTTAIAQGKNRF